jgi:hypothetical protein
MNGPLPEWLERWLGVDSSTSGEGTTWRVTSSWDFPPSVTLAVLILAAGWAGVLYWREGGEAGRFMRGFLALLRFLVFSLVLFMLAEFVVSLERTGLPHLAVLFDESASMSIADRHDARVLSAWDERLKKVGFDEMTRINLARTPWLENDAAWVRELSDRYKLRFYFVSADARGASTSDDAAEALRAAEATGESSRLGRAVRSVLNDLRGTPPAAVVLMSDGITTEGESLSQAADYAKRRGVPLYVVGIGSGEPVRDVSLLDLVVDEVVFVNDVINFEVKLLATGYAGRPLRLVLKDKPDGTVIEEMPVTAGPDGQPELVRLTHRPTTPGEYDYTLEISPLADETSVENNRITQHVTVVKQEIKVLFVQSYPNYEFRFLKHLLERDHTIKVSVVLQESDAGYAQSDPSALPVFPTRRDDLFAYDVIVFGDVNPTFLTPSALANLSAFVVEKGGGILFVAGPMYTPTAFRGTPLEALFPMELESVAIPDPRQTIVDGFQVIPTPLGLASPPFALGDTVKETEAVWTRLPELYWLMETPNMKPGARILAEHPVRLTADGRRFPVVSMQFVGAGKVLFHHTDETWRWRRRIGDAYLARYWVQAFRSLSRSKLLGKDRPAELDSDARSYSLGQPVRLRVRFYDERQAPNDDDGVDVVIERKGRPDERITLTRDGANRGLFERTIEPEVGSYHAWMARPSVTGTAPAADFTVEPPAGELHRIPLDTRELRQAAKVSFGRYYDLASFDRLPIELPKGQQVPVEGLPPIPLWNRWPVLGAFLLLIVSEWAIRKFKGML